MLTLQVEIMCIYVALTWSSLCLQMPDADGMAHKGVDRNSDVQIQAWFIINIFTCLFTEAEWCIYESVYYPIIGSDNGLSPFRHQAIIWTCDQSGTKPNLVAKILATNFGVFF